MNIIKVTCPKCGTTLTVNNTNGAFSKNLKCPVCSYTATASNYILEPEDAEQEVVAEQGTPEPVSAPKPTPTPAPISVSEAEKIEVSKVDKEVKQQPVVNEPAEEQSVQPQVETATNESDEVKSDDFGDFFSKLDYKKICMAIISSVAIFFVVYCLVIFLTGMFLPDDSTLSRLASLEPSQIGDGNFKQLEIYNLFFLAPASILAGIVIAIITKKLSSETYNVSVFASYFFIFMIYCIGNDEYPNVSESTVETWIGIAAAVIVLCMYGASSFMRGIWGQDD